MKLRHLSEPNYLPVLDKSFAIERRVLGLAPDAPSALILLPYGSLRTRSYSAPIVLAVIRRINSSLRDREDEGGRLPDREFTQQKLE